jgi:hypothetical protein
MITHPIPSLPSRSIQIRRLSGDDPQTGFELDETFYLYNIQFQHRYALYSNLSKIPRKKENKSLRTISPNITQK